MCILKIGWNAQDKDRNNLTCSLGPLSIKNEIDMNSNPSDMLFTTGHALKFILMKATCFRSHSFALFNMIYKRFTNYEFEKKINMFHFLRPVHALEGFILGLLKRFSKPKLIHNIQLIMTLPFKMGTKCVTWAQSPCCIATVHRTSIKRKSYAHIIYIVR